MTARISRRELLQITSVAPLTALLLSGTATSEAIAALTTSVRKEIDQKLLNKAKAKKVPDLIDSEFKKAVNILMEYFLAGADKQGLIVPDDDSIHIILFVDVAYDQPVAGNKISGNLIASRTKTWGSWLHETVACAYMCGAEFAQAANADEHFSFEDRAKVATAYSTAFDKVKGCMGPLLNRARAVREQRGEPELANMGAGC